MRLEELSNTELRLEIAEAEAIVVKTWKGRFTKRNRIEAATNLLVQRGAF